MLIHGCIDISILDVVPSICVCVYSDSERRMSQIYIYIYWGYIHMLFEGAYDSSANLIRNFGKWIVQVLFHSVLDGCTADVQAVIRACLSHSFPAAAHA